MLTRFLPIQNSTHDIRIPWYRSYRIKTWHKLNCGPITLEQSSWLFENVGERTKLWEWDNVINAENFSIVLEMLQNGTLGRGSGHPIRLFFKQEDDKVKFILRWL